MAYDRFAQQYNVTRVLDLHTLQFNSTAYEEYSPVYLPISFAMTYMLAFAIPTASLVHTILVYWPMIRDLIQRKAPKEEPDDIHAKLMTRYPAVPWWWYVAVFVVAFALSIGSMKVRNCQSFITANHLLKNGFASQVQPELELPVSIILLAILLTVVWIIPVCYISAISGQTPALNLIAQIIPGALWQDRPFVNMVGLALLARLRLGGIDLCLTGVQGLCRARTWCG